MNGRLGEEIKGMSGMMDKWDEEWGKSWSQGMSDEGNEVKKGYTQ